MQLHRMYTDWPNIIDSHTSKRQRTYTSRCSSWSSTSKYLFIGRGEKGKDNLISYWKRDRQTSLMYIYRHWNRITRALPPFTRGCKKHNRKRKGNRKSTAGRVIPLPSLFLNFFTQTRLCGSRFQSRGIHFLGSRSRYKGEFTRNVCGVSRSILSRVKMRSARSLFTFFANPGLMLIRILLRTGVCFYYSRDATKNLMRRNRGKTVWNDCYRCRKCLVLKKRIQF